MAETTEEIVAKTLVEVFEDEEYQQNKQKNFQTGEDIVNHPEHYKKGGIETIDFINAKDLGYEAGNVIKYIVRYRLKGNPLEDLKKAKWYIEHLIALEETS